MDIMYHGVSYEITPVHGDKISRYFATCFNELVGYSTEALVPVKDIKTVDLYFNNTPYRIYISEFCAGVGHRWSSWHLVVNRILGKQYFTMDIIQSFKANTTKYTFNPVGLTFPQFKLALFLIRHGWNHPFVMAHHNALLNMCGEATATSEQLWRLVSFLTFHPQSIGETHRDTTHSLFINKNFTPKPIKECFEQFKNFPEKNPYLHEELCSEKSTVSKFWGKIEKQPYLDFSKSSIRDSSYAKLNEQFQEYDKLCG